MTEQQPDSDLMKCPYCGKMTSKSANFCYYCTRQLISRPERPSVEDPPVRINWLWVGVGLAVVVLIYLLFFIPK